jgi:hypothetical protein
MLTLSPIHIRGGHYAVPAPALDSLRLHSRRRFLTPHEALAWFLTAPWTQAQ